MSGTLHILVVDDHAIVREGIVRILAGAGLPWSIEQAVGGDDALLQLGMRPTDLIVTDMSMPGLCGLDLIRRLHVAWPNLRILVLTMHADLGLATRAFRAGAHGYLTKDRAGSELVGAVLRVAGGENYVARGIAEHVATHLHGQDREPGLERLTNREFDIFRRLVAGRRLTEIADDMRLSLKTVRSHKRRIQIKLAVDSIAALVHYGVRNGVCGREVPG